MPRKFLNSKQIRAEALVEIARQKSVPIACFNCACNEPDLLKIHHLKGKGSEEIREIYQRAPAQFYSDIINGFRKTNDLGILCRVCNNLDYIESKFPHLKNHYTVLWSIKPISSLDRWSEKTYVTKPFHRVVTSELLLSEPMPKLKPLGPSIQRAN